jgi:integrase
MGTIIQRSRTDGSIAYMGQISLMRDGRIVHRESKTFDRRQAASAWIRKRETELSKPGAQLGVRPGARNVRLGEAIDRYLAEAERAVGRTKAQVLSTLKTYDIAELPCADIGSPDIVELARALRVRMQPQTVANYLSHLAAIFAIARPAWGYPLERQAMADALTVVKRLGLTAKSRQRDRRPTLQEMDELMAHFSELQRRRPNSTPMPAVVAFALFSTRRLEEITRLRWCDLDRDGKRILVRDMKNPGETIGNHVWCDLPEQALRILSARLRTGDRIFPVSPDAIGAAFTRACHLLAIGDLHFHDLRHEGVSRLFEIGWNIPHVAAVSGHRSWASLKRYTHLRHIGDKYAGWAWFDYFAPPTS